jgi:cellulose synthase/poly-beta-1,6-N-acetylglucosamine synthase-like glycosyltransferase
MQEVKAIGGFDKELEMRILESCYRIEYHPDAYVLDEKVQQKEVFASQRKRWLSAQFIYFGRYIRVGFRELFLRANVDLFDKVIQMIQLPRLILIGLLTLIGFINGIITWINPLWAHENMMIEFYNWLTIWLMTAIALLISVPVKFYNKNTLKAIMSLPGSFAVMLLSLFRLRGANRQFIHTQHGVGSSDNNDK